MVEFNNFKKVMQKFCGILKIMFEELLISEM